MSNLPPGCDGDDLRDLAAALVIAHPGHECRVLSWTEHLRPRVAVLTDGSGRRGVPRLSWSAALLRDLGARPGAPFGAAGDLEVYRAVLEQDHRFFRNVACVLADSLVRHRIELVLGDSAEGEIMSHDLFREVRIAAVRIAEAQRGCMIRQFEFPLASHPLAIPWEMAGHARLRRLDGAALQRKVAVVRRYEELSLSLDGTFAKYGEEAGSLEAIFPFCMRSLMPTDRSQPLGYELHGREQCGRGHYRQVITWNEHIRPIAADLARFALERAAPHSPSLPRAA
jgi:hypothetical protein